MRASLLSSPDVIAALNKDYLSSWVLFQDLLKVLKIDDIPMSGIESLNQIKARAAKLTDTGTDYERLCARLLAGYNYPVDSHVFSSSGKFIGNIKAEELFSDPYIEQRFLKLLQDGANH